MRKDKRVAIGFLIVLIFTSTGCARRGYVESNIPGVAAGLTAVRDVFANHPCRGDVIELRVDAQATAEVENENLGFLGVRQRVSVKRDCVSKEVKK